MCLEYLSLNASLGIISISKTSEGCLKYLQDYHYLPLSFQLSTLTFILPLLIFPGLWEVLHPRVQLSLFILWTVDFLLARSFPPSSLSSSFLSPVFINPSLVRLPHYTFRFILTPRRLPSWSAWLSGSASHIVPGCAVGSQSRVCSQAGSRARSGTVRYGSVWAPRLTAPRYHLLCLGA